MEEERTRREMSLSMVAGWGTARARERGKMEKDGGEPGKRGGGTSGSSFYTTQLNLEDVGGIEAGPKALVTEII